MHDHGDETDPIPQGDGDCRVVSFFDCTPQIAPNATPALNALAEKLHQAHDEVTRVHGLLGLYIGEIADDYGQDRLIRVLDDLIQSTPGSEDLRSVFEELTQAKQAHRGASEALHAGFRGAVL